MVCRNCGNEMRDDVRFCPRCGALNSPDLGRDLPEGAAPYSATACAGPEAPVPGRSKKGLLIGGAVAVAAVIALVAVLAGGLFSSPKKQVEAALVKSAAAYLQAEKALNMPDMSQWQKDQTVAQRMVLELKSVNSNLAGYDLSALSGLGLRLSADYDGKARKMSFDMGACWGEDDLISLRMAANDAELYFSSPQLTGETSYGVNTETLGADIAKLTGEDSVKDLSFNLFKLVDLVLERVDREAAERSLKEAGKALWDAAQVEKLGKEDLDINGTRTKTNAYLVTIPQDALDRYADSLTEVLSSMNYTGLYEELYRSMGMPQAQIDEIMSALTEADVYGKLANSLKDAIEKTGDLELAVYVGGGYVSKAVYHYNRSGIDLTAALCLGGGEEYVDDLSLELYTDKGRVTVTSTGDHGGRSGVFTDRTTVKGDPLRTSLALSSITSEFRYEPKKADENFSWELAVPGAGSLSMSGALDAKPDSLSLNLDGVSLKVMGMDVCTLGLDYHVDCHPSPAAAGNPQLLTQMNELELMMTALSVQNKATAWMSDMKTLFSSRLPAELYNSLF